MAQLIAKVVYIGCTVSVLLTYSITFESKSPAFSNKRIFFRRRFREIQGGKTRGQKPIIIVILACLLTKMPPKWIVVWYRKIQNACAAINCVCKWGEMDLFAKDVEAGSTLSQWEKKNTVALLNVFKFYNKIKVQKMYTVHMCVCI